MRISFGRPAAIACISGGKPVPDLRGTVKLYSMGSKVLVVTDVCGLPESKTGIFALHIHGGKSCTGENFADTGSHFDGAERPHPMHAGDLPPLFSCNGKAFLAVVTDRFHIRQVIGKSVVIHQDPDDFVSQPAGNSGLKIGCGTIRWCPE